MLYWAAGTVASVCQPNPMLVTPALHARVQVSRCSSPQEAAKTLVATAYKTWLQRETRTDDITALVLFFQPCSPSKQLGRWEAEHWPQRAALNVLPDDRRRGLWGGPQGLSCNASHWM